MSDDTQNGATQTDRESTSQDDGSDRSPYRTSRRSVLGGFAASAAGAAGGLSSDYRLAGAASGVTADVGEAADCADPTQWPPDEKEPWGDHLWEEAFSKVNIDDQVIKVTDGLPGRGPNQPSDGYHDLTCPGIVEVEPGESFDVHVETSAIDIDNESIPANQNLFVDLFVDWDGDQNWDTYQQTRIVNRNEFEYGVAAVETVSVPEDAPTGSTLGKLRLAQAPKQAPENVLREPHEEPWGQTLNFTVRVREGSGDASTAQQSVDSLWLLQQYTDSGDAEFVADWAVSSSGGSLSEVTLALVDEAEGSREDSATVAVGGGSASERTPLVAAGDDRSGHSYTVELTATDEDGNSTTDTASATENRHRGDLHIQDVSLNPVGSEDGDAEFVVGATHFGDPIERAELTLTDDADGEREDTWEDTEYSPGGYTAQMLNQRLLAEGDAGSGNSYTAKLTITDESGSTVTETSSATVGRDDRAPDIDDLSLSTVDTDTPHAEFEADWAVSDRNHDLLSVGLLLHDENGEQKQWVGTEVRDESDSDTTRLKAPGEGGSGKTYTAELVVTDRNGNTTSGTASASATGRAGNCVVEHFSSEDGPVSDRELLRALRQWRDNEPVAGCGRQVSYTDLLELITRWRSN